MRLEDVRDQKGVTLTETLVGVAITGVVAVVILSAVATASRTVSIADLRTTGESLARSQVEYVKSQGYIYYSIPGHGEYSVVTAPATYSVGVSAIPVDPGNGQPLPSGQDVGIQRIRVTVERSGRPVFTVDDYKVDR